MDEIPLDERQLILQLALQEAYRKLDECQSDFVELNNKLSIITADGCSFAEKDKIVESMLYLEKCRNGWQETINYTRSWQDSLK